MSNDDDSVLSPWRNLNVCIAFMNEKDNVWMNAFTCVEETGFIVPDVVDMAESGER